MSKKKKQPLKSKSLQKKNSSEIDDRFHTKAWFVLLMWLVLVVGISMAISLSSAFTREKLSAQDNSDLDNISQLVEKGVGENRYVESRKLWEWWISEKNINQQGSTPLLYPENEIYNKLQSIDKSLEIQPTSKALLTQKMLLLNQLNRVTESELVLQQLKQLDPNDIWIREYESLKNLELLKK